MGRDRGETKDFSEKLWLLILESFASYLISKTTFPMDLSGTCFVLIIPKLLYPACLANHWTFPPNSTLSLNIYIQPYLSHGLNCVSFTPSCLHCSTYSTFFLKSNPIFRWIFYDMFHPDHHLVWRWLFPMMSLHHRLLAAKTHLKQRNTLKTNRKLIWTRQCLFKWELWLTLFDHVIL